MKLIRITTVPISLKILLCRQLRYMSSYFDVIAVSSPGTMLDDVRVIEGVRTVPVLMTRAITPVRDIIALWELYKLFRKEKPSIIHTHTPKAGLLGMVAGLLAGVPVRMHTVAGLPLMEKKGITRKILVLTERLTYYCATTVYPNSWNLASFIKKSRFCNPEKIKVLGNGSSNGIDMAYYHVTDSLISTAKELRQRLQINENHFIYIFIGRMVKDKGIEELVEAFIQLKAKRFNIKLLLVGHFEHELDPVSGHIRHLIDTDPDIIHEGFQKDVRPYLMISQVLTFPSYREGFPNVPMQAACFDLPSIVTDINGCNEIIEHKKNGLIIPVKDIQALRIAMETLLADRKIYLQLRANARKYIFDRYEQKYFWKLLLKEYMEQLGTPHLSHVNEEIVVQ